MKRIRRLLFLPVFLSIVFVMFVVGDESAAAISPKTISKEDFPWEDTVLTGVEPNVLFFLDTSSSMTMSMQGELPTFNPNDAIMRESLVLMRDADFRAAAFVNATYGTGSRPVSIGTQTALDRLLTGGIPDTETEQEGYYRKDATHSSKSLGYTRWGRDLSSGNNIIGNPDCYYTPDPHKPYFLTFKDRNWANWNGTGSPPKAFGNGLAEAEKGGGDIDMPPNLGSYLPGGGNYGRAITDPDLIRYLVPNDSKMYQMKLVLWRLLEGTNAQMLSQMRLGVAGNFFDYFYNFDLRGAMYRRPPYRSYGEDPNEGENNRYQGGFSNKFKATHEGVADTWTEFPHGTAPEAYSGIIGGDYGNTEQLYSGVLTSYEAGNENQRRHGRRAYLRVPFDFMYTKNADGTYNPTSALFAFRELIDGVEQFDSGKARNADKIVNEELIAGGTTMLSTSFYGRDGLHATAPDGANQSVLGNRYAIDYARGSLDFRELWVGIQNPYGILAKRIRNSERLMTGTALGSAIDFFSPFGGTHGLGFTQYPKDEPGVEADDTRGYFPVTGSCQTNWMVVFTGGNEMAIPGYDPVEALKKLYVNSRKLRGRHWDGEKWIERTYDMDSPIRTVFVGILPPADTPGADGDPYAPDRADDSGAKRLRKAVTRMAHAGQPLPDGSPNRSIQPYFADNVPGLIQALQSILLQIRTERFAAGAPIILPMTEGADAGGRALYAASYSINRFQQWEGTFHKYHIWNDPGMTETLEWKAEENMSSMGDSRNVYTTMAGEGTTSTAVAELRGMTAEAFKELTGVTSHDTDFRDWLITYENEPGILGDMEHSGFANVAQGSNFPREGRVYLQTNRGILHALDLVSGDEKWAFIPPNVFQNRLRDQKFFPLDSSWYTGDGMTGIQSTPLVLLDGMLAASDVKMGSGYKTFMIGNLGWGGNGLYAMDVTEVQDEPKFLWAMENARYTEQEITPLDGVKLWGDAAAGNKNLRDYSELGLTLAATEVRNTGTYDSNGNILRDEEGREILRDGVGILPGGLGFKAGLDSQGKVFYIFDPENAEIIRKITSASGFIAPLGRSLGMGIAPVYYIPVNKTSLATKEFFTGDSEGNVLYCDMRREPSAWNLKSIFQLRTVTPPDRPVAITQLFEIWQRWLFGGTSDLMVPGHRTLPNDEQFIFGLNLTNNPNMDDAESVSVSAITTTDLVRLKYMKDDLNPAWSGAEDGNQVSVPNDAKGWRLQLRPKIIHPTEPTEAEYVTTPPAIYQGVLYVSTFVARTRQPDDDEKCPELGDGKLYAFDPMTGRGMWSDGKQALVFNNIKIAGISASGGKLFLGIKALQGGALEALRHHSDLYGFKAYAEGTAIALTALGTADEGEANVPYNIPLLHYWKERF